MKVAKSIGQQNLRIRDRHLKGDFPDAFKGFSKEIANLRATTEIATELSKNSPPWLLDLGRVQGLLQYLAWFASEFYTRQGTGPRVLCRWTFGC